MTIVCSLIGVDPLTRLNDLVFGMHGIWRSFLASEFCPWGRDQTEPELDSRCIHGSWGSGVKKCISVPFILLPFCRQSGENQSTEGTDFHIYVCIPLKAEFPVTRQSFGN